jgi:hypothetical protein
MDQPKWQRARIMEDPEAGFEAGFEPGTLIWVRNGRPRFGVADSRMGCVVGPILETNRHIHGHRAAFFRTDLELLPEFSFDDDPDATPRQ